MVVYNIMDTLPASILSKNLCGTRQEVYDFLGQKIIQNLLQ